MSQIEIRHLRTLVALRETGSLVEASERVFLTQSALSHQIKELEGRLGCSLFLRKSRPVRFTSAGNRLLELADEVLPRLHKAHHFFHRFDDSFANEGALAWRRKLLEARETRAADAGTSDAALASTIDRAPELAAFRDHPEVVAIRRAVSTPQ